MNLWCSIYREMIYSWINVREHFSTLMRPSRCGEFWCRSARANRLILAGYRRLHSGTPRLTTWPIAGSGKYQSARAGKREWSGFEQEGNSVLLATSYSWWFVGCWRWRRQFIREKLDGSYLWETLQSGRESVWQLLPVDLPLISLEKVDS